MSDQDPSPSTPQESSSGPSKSDARREEWGRLIAVVRLAIAGLYRSQIPRMAAAMSYRTIFSIIPVMAIGLLIFGSFVSEEEVDSGVRRVLEYAGISQIAAVQIEETDTQDPPDDLQTDQDQIDLPTLPESIVPPQSLQPNTSPIEPESADSASAPPESNLEEVISDLITRVNTSIRNVPTGWIAMASIVILIYAAMSMLIEIEKSFNQLCAAPAGRPWLRRLMLYWTMLTLGTLLLAATFVAGDALARWIIQISSDENGSRGTIGATFASFGVSVLISTI